MKVFDRFMERYGMWLIIVALLIAALLIRSSFGPVISTVTESQHLPGAIATLAAPANQVQPTMTRIALPTQDPHPIPNVTRIALPGY